MHNKDIGIIACDLRQLYMANYLTGYGFGIHIFYSDKMDYSKEFREMLKKLEEEKKSKKINITDCLEDIICECDILAGPVPFKKIADFMTIPGFVGMVCSNKKREGFTFCAGIINDYSKKTFEDEGIRCVDLYKSKGLGFYNAIATAEGIIAKAIMNSRKNLHGSRVLVLGYGKCGSVLAKKLEGLSCRVTVAGRNMDSLAEMYAMGHNVLKLEDLRLHISEYDYIFNTIPDEIIDENMCRCISYDTLILDVASEPGVNKTVARQFKIPVIHDLGIPGVTAPEDSGVVLGKMIYRIICDSDKL